MTNYYKILGIDKSASQQEIKRAYRKLSIKFHPDKNDGDPFFENMFKQIQEAYEVLGDAQKRYAYDQNHRFHKPSQKNNHTNFEPVIEYFSTDKTLFYSGDEIKFEWKTYNADLVEIKPFGIVNSTGTKTFKLNNVNRRFITVELKATNTHIAKYVSEQITLENKIFKDAKSQSSRKGRSSEPYHNPTSYKTTGGLKTETFWSAKGRLRRRTYFTRVVLLSIPYAIVFGIVENSYDDGLIVFAGMLGLVCWITISIQAIKRLHDINISGWWYLLFLIPYVNLVFGLVILFVDGTKGINKYGYDPKNR
ncbi:MAG TPA: DnaJ domain-containing protein [Flavobacteriaceae bacterium]|nr:DnaJ domain-containing protein [Flavobacteriaceae bacterium]